MECLSQKFIAAMRRLLDSRRLLVAAIAQRGAGFIAEAKGANDVELWELTHANRKELPERALAWLQSAGGFARHGTGS